MIARARRETVRFLHPATIAGVDRELAAGDYEVVIEEELIEGLSFASYRRVATLITVPSASMRAVEMVAIESAALADAQHRDSVTAQGIVTIAPVSDKPVDLDAHRGMAAQKATDLRRTLVAAESAAAKARAQQRDFEAVLRDTAAASWSDAAAKARYVLNLYGASLGQDDSHHRDLVASILRDFDRLDAGH